MTYQEIALRLKALGFVLKVDSDAWFLVSGDRMQVISDEAIRAYLMVSELLGNEPLSPVTIEWHEGPRA